mgnify:FL=1
MAAKGRFRPRNPEKYRGDPTKIIYRSGWEARFFQLMDENKDVVWWQSEEVIVPYRDPLDGKIHRYFPDVVYQTIVEGVPKTIMVEIKPHAQTLPPNPANRNKTKTGRVSTRFLNEVKRYGKNDAKWKAAEQFCATRGWIFSKLTERDLKALGLL